MRKILYGFIVALLFLSIQASAQVGSTGVYKARSAGVDVKVVKKPRNAPFIGFNAGVGGTFGAITSIDGSLGFDLAFAPGKKFAMGFFTGYETFSKINVGLLFVHGDYSSRGAFLWGFGSSYIMPYNRDMTYMDEHYNRRYYGSRFLMRFGFMSKSPWYYNVTLSFGQLSKYDSYTNSYSNDYYWIRKKGIVGINMSVGYKLNTKSKKTNE